MKNFRHLKVGLLTWKALIYRIISITIFSLLFGYKFALCAGLLSLIIYYIYDCIFHKIFRLSNDKGFVLWFTGLPCSGKSTIADEIAIELKKRGIKVERLDGDIVRKGKLSNDLGFSKDDRDKNINRITFVSRVLSRNEVAVLASFVSPYEKTRQKIRENVTNFVEIYVDASVGECVKRDVKGMWKLAKEGKIKGFTGYDDPYEIPQNPELICDTVEESLKESTNKVLSYLESKRLI